MMLLRRLQRLLVMCTALSFILAGCANGNAAGNGSRLVIAGSSTIQPVIDIAAERYREKDSSITIDVQGGGSSVGISSVRSGLSQIGMVSRDLHPDEQDLVATPIAYDGIAIIVHQSNPVKALTQEQVVAIYSGAVKSWKDLGGADLPITVINKEEGRATLELFEQHFKLKGKFVPNAVIIGPNGQAISTTAGNPGAISYVSIGSAVAAVAEGTAIHLVQLDGVEPTAANVQKQAYPLRRNLNLVTQGEPTGHIRDFIDFLLGPDGQQIVVDQGFVSLTTSQ